MESRSQACASGRTGIAIVRSLACAVLCLALVFGAGKAWSACDDYSLTQAELTSILDGTLGGIRSFVLDRQVTVDARQTGCYLQMQLDVGFELGPIRQSCRATACSVGLASGTQIGIRRFSIGGCDAIFQATGRSREIDTVFADIADRIRAHCGSDKYRISKVAPAGAPDQGVIRLSFEPLGK